MIMLECKMKYLRAAIGIKMLVEMPSPFQNLLHNGVSHPRFPLSKLGKPITKLAQQCKWSEKSTKTWETKYLSRNTLTPQIISKQPT